MLFRRLLAEFIGISGLLVVVVGSGIMGEQLSGGNAALALLANAIATGAGLFVLINVFAPISGAHFNPIVTLAVTYQGNLNKKAAGFYLLAQFAGAVFGVMIANLMFDIPIVAFSEKERMGMGLWLGEFVATFGLILVILRLGQRSVVEVAATVALYITSAYWFTSSTSFANPAVTMARALTPTFAGIELSGVLPFIIAQSFGAIVAVCIHRFFQAHKI